jgi:hypothetical protein
MYRMRLGQFNKKHQILIEDPFRLGYSPLKRDESQESRFPQQRAATDISAGVDRSVWLVFLAPASNWQFADGGRILGCGSRAAGIGTRYTSSSP